MKYFLSTLAILLLVTNGCDNGSDSATSTGGTEAVQVTADTSTSESNNISLSAFNDFDCDSNWATRDGAMGLLAESKSGVCQASFPGATGNYSVQLTIQTEFDGTPKYKLTADSQTLSSGQYPLSSSLGCDCPKDDWHNVCPDKQKVIDAGVHTISQGSSIGFTGEAQWNCDDHGAYAKWHKVDFIKQ